MDYWIATDRIIAENGGRNPTCSTCGQEMFPIDDHGRFSCGCTGLFGELSGARTAIPQVDTTSMTDEQKAAIPPMNRLHSAPTVAEAEFLSLLMKGPNATADPGYAAACKKLIQERG